MSDPKHGTRPTRSLWFAGTALTALTAIANAVFSLRTTTAEASPTAPAPVIAVSVAIVVKNDATTRDDLPGRLEAVERVDNRSRVGGTVQSAHFPEGARVRKGDLLLTIDPAPYAAETERAEARVAAAQARTEYAKSKYERA